MLSLNNKINILKKYLYNFGDSYFDSWKTDIIFFFNNFNNYEDSKFHFLKKYNSEKEIIKGVENLISKIILKFDENEEQLSDFIFYQLNN